MRPKYLPVKRNKTLLFNPHPVGWTWTHKSHRPPGAQVAAKNIIFIIYSTMFHFVPKEYFNVCKWHAHTVTHIYIYITYIHICIYILAYWYALIYLNNFNIRIWDPKDMQSSWACHQATADWSPHDQCVRWRCNDDRLAADGEGNQPRKGLPSGALSLCYGKEPVWTWFMIHIWVKYRNIKGSRWNDMFNLTCKSHLNPSSTARPAGEA